MSSYKLFFEINSNYISLFAGFIKDKEIFTLDFIERNYKMAHETGYYKFNDEIILTLREMLDKLNEDLKNTNITFTDFSIIFNTPDIVYNSTYKTLTNKSFGNSKNIAKALNSIILSYDNYDGFKNICIDNLVVKKDNEILPKSNKLKTIETFDVYYNIYRINADLYNKIKTLEDEFKMKVRNIYPSTICKVNLVKTLFNVDTFNLVDLNLNKFTLVCLDNGCVTKIEKLETTLSNLYFGINKKVKNEEQTKFFIEKYGYSNIFDYEIPLVNEYTIANLNEDIKDFYSKSLNEINKKIKNKNKIFFFGDGSRIYGFDSLLKDMSKNEYEIFKFDVLGARNYHSYASLGALILEEQNDSTDYSFKYIVRGDL